MSTVYHTTTSFSTPISPATFEQRWNHVKSLLRLQLVARDAESLDPLLEAARQVLCVIYTREAALLDSTSDQEWMQMALRGILRIDETQTPFERQFEIIERRLHHWARQHFKAELVEDVLQGAFINLWNDYQRHQEEWDTKTESYWVSCAKLAMRSAFRDLLSQTCSRKGSSRRHEKSEWVQHTFRPCDFPTFDDSDSDQRNDLLDLLSQNADVDIHGSETRRANLRLDLEALLKAVKQHYNPAIFERCLLVLDRLTEGYTPAEIRLELGWTKVTYESTMTFIRRMITFADGYERAPNRCAKMSSAEIARIHTMRQAGCTQPEIARRIGRDPKTVWRVLQSAQAS